MYSSRARWYSLFVSYKISSRCVADTAADTVRANEALPSWNLCSSFPHRGCTARRATRRVRGGRTVSRRWHGALRPLAEWGATAELRPRARRIPARVVVCGSARLAAWGQVYCARAYASGPWACAVPAPRAMALLHGTGVVMVHCWRGRRGMACRWEYWQFQESRHKKTNVLQGLGTV